MDYRSKAIRCLKDGVLPELMRRFRECGSDMDAYCQKYGETEFSFARVIERGHIYEMGYPRCLCPEAPVGKQDVSFCECSRQGTIYVLQNMMPGKHFEVELVETVLGGGGKCRFRVTMDESTAETEPGR